VQLRDVTKAEALDAPRCAITFTGTQYGDLPLVVASLPILSKAYYATREFDQTTLEPPLGSGPYQIGDFKQGAIRQLQAPRRLLGKDLPVNRGRFNFDELRLRVLS
jgi:microcin C transport system substrate-binding protein